MKLELSESFVSEKDQDLEIKVTVDCEEITIGNSVDKKQHITLTLKELKKVVCIYEAFLVAKEASNFDLHEVTERNYELCNRNRKQAFWGQSND